MNAKLLLSYYEQIADAPDAVARLRQFILDLAVRGKLVPQDPSDEPASELLKRIEKEKRRLTSSGQIRKPRDLEWADELEVLFEIPHTWVWCRLSEVGAIVGGGTPSSTDATNFTDPGLGIAWLTPADLGKHNALYISRGARDLTEVGLHSSSATIMPKDSVLFTSRAPIGYVAIAANEISTNQGFKSVVPYITDCSRYIALYLQALAVWIDSKASGTTFREVSGKIVAGIPFALPPLAEQRRIVARLDELMALCDRLEQARAEREAQRDRLAAATLARLSQPADEPRELREHAAFALEQLAALTTRPDQVKALRQTILNLAVHGRLVEQDESDDSLEIVIDRLEHERLGLVLGHTEREVVIQEYSKIRRNLRDHFSKQVHISAKCICDFITKGTTPANNELLQEGEVPYIKVYNIINNKIDFFYKPTFISQTTHETKLKRSKVFPGDVLMNIVGPPLGKVAIVPKDFQEWNINQALAIFRPLSEIENRFLYLVLSCNTTLEAVLKDTHGTAGQDNLSLEQCRNLPIPLYPLSMQRRIVAKVDELMALCDRLEASLTTGDGTRRRLLDAVLSAALEPATVGSVPQVRATVPRQERLVLE